MFKGTQRYAKGEIDYITARLGGSNNAFTSNDYTAYYFTFASDRWWPALEIEADRMRNNRFETQEFELERQVVLEELRMELDSPWGLLRQAVETRSFTVHPYRFPVIGSYEDLQAMTRQQMIDYYDRFYSPSNAILVLAGDFRTEEVLDRVEQLFGHLSAAEATMPALDAEPTRTQQSRVELQKPTHVPRMFIAFPAPSVRQKAHYALHILDKLLSEGKLSRLYRRLIEEEQVASFVSTEFLESFDPYLFAIRVGIHPGADLARVEALVFKEIAKLREDSVSETELRRAKNQCVTQALISFETTLDQAMQLGLMETQDCYQYWADYPGQISQLTVQQVQRVAQEYWTPEQATVGVLSNEIEQKQSGSLQPTLPR